MKQEDKAGPFYVDPKLDDIPKWAELEWDNLLRQMEMSTVQDNIDSAMDNLNRGERILQDNKENFDEIMTNMEEEMLERTLSIQIQEDMVREKHDRVKQRESEQNGMEEEYEQVQIRKKQLKEKEELYKERWKIRRKQLLKGCEL